MKIILITIFLFSFPIYSQNVTATIINDGVGVYKEPSITADLALNYFLDKGTRVKAISYDNEYWKISYHDTVGYVRENNIDGGMDFIELKKNSPSQIELAKIKKANKQKHLKELEKLYPKKIAKKIFNHEIWIGMNVGMAFSSMGIPDKINKYVNETGAIEQWVYNNRVFYILKMAN